MSIDSFLNRNYDIERATNVVDSFGSYTQTWAIVMTVNGRMRPLSEMERWPARGVMGREGRLATHRLYLAGSPAVRVVDRAIDQTVDGTYYFSQVGNPGNTGGHLEIDCWKEDA